MRKRREGFRRATRPASKRDPRPCGSVVKPAWRWEAPPRRCGTAFRQARDRRRSRMSPPAEPSLLGQVVPDAPTATNERVMIQAGYRERHRVVRNQFVTITDAVTPQTVFLGRVVGGPFFPGQPEGTNEVCAEVEVQGEM